MTATEPYAHAATDVLPTSEPLALISADGSAVEGSGLRRPSDDVVLDLYRGMVIGRRFDAQATALTKQGRLAVYPSSRGQEACQVGAVRALHASDWLFPTYRDTMAIVTRGVDPVDALGLLRGDWHLGYDPYQHRVAPQCTPLATNALHAVGLARAAVMKHEPTAALVLMGDGATSEGDAHEAFNFAAVWRAPVVFLVQNNGFAISVPTSKQSVAPSFAHKGIGYGLPAQFVDGNDAAAVTVAVGDALERARRGGGPTLIEARTYRVEAHTNADDASRYRSADDVLLWLSRDPVDRLDHYLSARGSLDSFAKQAIADEAESLADSLRRRMNVDPQPTVAELFSHVYAEVPDHLRRAEKRLTADVG
jgi:2-oxoisovalerate dehydrogenase E1 component alpha subunit